MIESEIATLPCIFYTPKAGAISQLLDTTCNMQLSWFRFVYIIQDIEDFVNEKMRFSLFITSFF